MPTIVIAAGGTAGHVVPALAVADELRASGARVVFTGTRGRAEAELVPSAGYEISYLSVAGLDRRAGGGALPAHGAARLEGDRRGRRALRSGGRARKARDRVGDALPARLRGQPRRAQAERGGAGGFCARIPAHSPPRRRAPRSP